MEHTVADKKLDPRAQLASHHVPYYARLRRRRYSERHSGNGWLSVGLGTVATAAMTVTFVIGVSFAILGAGYAYIVSLLPTQIELRPIGADQSTKIYDRYGNIL